MQSSSDGLTPLEDYDVLDTPPEAAFDDLARLAAWICQTPMAFVTFLDGRRQFFKARIKEGTDDAGGAREAPLEEGFCPAAAVLGQMLVIPDTRADARFRDNPAALADPPARFYAGVPLRAPDGSALGTLCVVDHRPRPLSGEQGEALRVLGRQVETLMELRRVAAAQARSEEASRESASQLRSVADALPALIAYVDAGQRYRFNNSRYEEWIGIPAEQIRGRTLREVLGADTYAALATDVEAALSGRAVTYERDLTWPDGRTRSVRGIYSPRLGPEGVEGFAILVTDETEAKRADLEREQMAAERQEAAGRQAVLVAAQQEVAQAARNLDAVLDIVTRRAQELAGADAAIVEMAEGEDMVYRAASGSASAHVGLRLARAASLSGRCVAEGRLLSCEDSEVDPQVDREACRRVGVRSMVVVPLQFLGRTVGVLKVCSPRRAAFADDLFSPLEMMVNLIVAALSAVSEAQARTALSLSEQRLHTLITSVPVILFALDGAGVFTQAEGKGLAALGLTPDAVVGRPCREVFPDSPALLENMARGLAGEAWQWLSEIGGFFFETRCLPLAAAGGGAGLIGVAFDVTERIRAEGALRQSAARQRQFLRDVLASVTEGRLMLCQSEADLPAPLADSSPPIPLTAGGGGLRELRQAAWEACQAAGLAEERGHDMITAASEAGMNCIVHVGEGVGQVFTDPFKGTVQVRVHDHGAGISLENLPQATLRKGFTTAGTLGHGMKMVLQTADHVHLLTGRAGTTVVLEQERVAPLPPW